MTLEDQIYVQAEVLAGKVDPAKGAMLRTLCHGVTAALTARLRPGLKPEDCKADFIAAGSLFALAALSSVDETSQLEQITVGDVVLKRRGGDTASNCLHNQAELIIAPYVKDRFAFLGV